MTFHYNITKVVSVKEHINPIWILHKSPMVCSIAEIISLYPMMIAPLKENGHVRLRYFFRIEIESNDIYYGDEYIMEVYVKDGVKLFDEFIWWIKGPNKVVADKLRDLIVDQLEVLRSPTTD